MFVVKVGTDVNDKGLYPKMDINQISYYFAHEARISRIVEAMED